MQSANPDPSTRLYEDAEERMKRKEALAQKHAPTFVPTLNKRTKKICQQIDDINKFIVGDDTSFTVAAAGGGMNTHNIS